MRLRCRVVDAVLAVGGESADFVVWLGSRGYVWSVQARVSHEQEIVIARTSISTIITHLGTTLCSYTGFGLILMPGEEE